MQIFNDLVDITVFMKNTEIICDDTSRIKRIGQPAGSERNRWLSVQDQDRPVQHESGEVHPEDEPGQIHAVLECIKGRHEPDRHAAADSGWTAAI